ncbi:MAG TPA: 3D-(3,5/4)-trihydroxycyclohexane-1,2-dione acylhydrolase (decyclizing) [Limnochordia bacterium]|nr:3D-(3,5/4)-trihydroxycyclohexane-1,2-dione acylhydrolase (decyclizing) [Limnochordia bacterium]
MKRVRMTMAQAIVRFLAAQYVSRDGVEQPFFAGVIGIFGHGNVTGLGQALEELDLLRYYQPRNEQAGVHWAAAYAKAKNRLQTFACTSSVGPGATNMLTGAAAATINRLPVLLLPGDTFASRLPHPVLQQLEHPMSHDLSVNDAFRPVSRFWDRINRPEQILSSLPEAMRILTDPAETGAVTLALPEDVQTEAYDYPAHFFEKRVYRIPRILPPESELAAALEMIRKAQRPLIIAGGGVIYSEAWDSLDRLATSCGIPVAETQAGKGVLPWNHPWLVGPVGANGGTAANRLAAKADLVIAIGTRLSDFTTASRTAFAHPEVRFIGLNIAPMDAYKFGALPLIADAREGIEALASALMAMGYRTSEAYQQEVAREKAEWDETVERLRRGEEGHLLSQAQVLGIVNEHSGPRDVVVNAAGTMPGDLLRLWRARDPKGYHVEYGYSTMGYEIPAGLGIKMADPSRNVYVLIGDGSYLMMNSEIVTAVQEGYKLTIVLVDNGGFQSIHGLQRLSGSPSFGNELRARDAQTGRLSGPYLAIDYAKSAESMGAKGFYADTADALREALKAADQEKGTALIHVKVDPTKSVPSFESWWDVPVAEVSSQPGVQEALEAYRKGRERQRFYY